MTQKFPEINQDDYIDNGIIELQDRDNAVLTLFSGDSAPTNPFTNLVWNDLTSHSLKWYHSNQWEVMIDYSQEYMNQSNLIDNYQSKNNKLTTYSSVETGELGLITTDWIPLSRFFLDNLAVDFEGSLQLGSFAYKSSITNNEIEDGTISIEQIRGEIITESPFETGDVIFSLSSNNNREGFVKLSKTKNVVFTVGGTSSNATYIGTSYKNLYKFVWENLDLPIYANNGIESNKGENWELDWNNNKKLELPCIKIPEDSYPQDFSATYGTDVDYIISKSGYYEITLVGGGGSGDSYKTSRFGFNLRASTGASAGGFKGQILLEEGDVLTYTVGAGGSSINIENGQDSSIVLNEDILVIAGGGEKGYARIPNIIAHGGAVTIEQPESFYSVVSNITGEDGVRYESEDRWTYEEISVNGPFLNDYGKGGSVIASSDPKIFSGNSGFFGIKFLAPKEYGTPDSDVKNKLDAFYEGISYFMKC